MKELKHPIREAERYLQNAREILSEKAGKDGDFYTDRKYVKMAGHTAWCGILAALDGVLGIKVPRKRRPHFEDYQEGVSKIDRKMNRPLLNVYETLHLVLGYDGNLRYKIVQDGLEEAQDIINWAEKHYHEPAVTNQARHDRVLRHLHCFLYLKKTANKTPTTKA